MSRRALLWILLTIVLAGPALAAETYGGGVTLTETTSIGKILAEPDLYVGRQVRVEGEVTDVCPMKGCWMEIAEPEGARLRIKVDDGAIVFPPTAKGKRVVAEGVLEKIPMDREEYIGWASHVAHEKGETFEESKIGNGPFNVLQIRGLGARIE